MADVTLSRRRFLAATGLLGTAAVAAQLPGVAGRSPAYAQSADDLLGPVLEGAGGLLETLALDTLGGLVAFVVPGDDAYSAHQGVTAPALGGIAAQGHRFLADALDRFLPVPDTMLAPFVRAMATSSASAPLEIPAELLAVPADLVVTLDEALLVLTENDRTVPLSAAIAMLINLAATLAAPASVAGPFLSPFANLDFAGKMAAWRLLEEDVTTVIGALDGDLPEPLEGSLAGLVAFVGGALVEFAAFGSYGEWEAFDAASGVATRRPVGWEMSDYLPGRDRPVHGWDEHLGYYGDVRVADGS